MSARTHLMLAMVLSVALVLALTACGGATEQPAATEEIPQQTEEITPPTDGETLYTPEYKSTGTETAVFKTSKGTIVVKLYGKDAPIHVANFVELVNKGFYDGTRFHRYEPGFVVQGGDPLSKGLTAEQVAEALQTGSVALGTGSPGYSIKGEFDPSVNPNKHGEGALGMARSQSPDSAGSQFYFALQPLPMLDGQYTVFGTVTEGLDVMKSLRVGDEIESVKIESGK